jgi:hypothetical protein
LRRSARRCPDRAISAAAQFCEKDHICAGRAYSAKAGTGFAMRIRDC